MASNAPQEEDLAFYWSAFQRNLNGRSNVSHLRFDLIGGMMVKKHTHLPNAYVQYLLAAHSKAEKKRFRTRSTSMSLHQMQHKLLYHPTLS